MEVEDMVLDSALVIMEQTLLQKDFIGERGFNKLISPSLTILQGCKSLQSANFTGCEILQPAKFQVQNFCNLRTLLT